MSSARQRQRKVNKRVLFLDIGLALDPSRIRGASLGAR
jgi:hypothetical protein